MLDNDVAVVVVVVIIVVVVVGERVDNFMKGTRLQWKGNVPSSVLRLTALVLAEPE